MTQYAPKIEPKKLKEWGKATVTEEQQQLPVLENFGLVDTTKLTKKKRAEAVTLLMFLKENSNGNIKWRACVDSRNSKTIKIRTRINLQLPQSQCL